MRSRKTHKRKHRGGGRPTGHPGSRHTRVLKNRIMPRYGAAKHHTNFEQVAKNIANASEDEVAFDSIGFLKKVQSLLDNLLEIYDDVDREPGDDDTLSYFAMVLAEKFSKSINEARELTETFSKSIKATANAATAANVAKMDELADLFTRSHL